MTPIIKHLNGQWCAMIGDTIVFRSLKRANVVDFIKYSWNGCNPYIEGT